MRSELPRPLAREDEKAKVKEAHAAQNALQKALSCGSPEPGLCQRQRQRIPGPGGGVGGTVPSTEELREPATQMKVHIVPRRQAFGNLRNAPVDKRRKTTPVTSMGDEKECQ